MLCMSVDLGCGWTLPKRAQNFLKFVRIGFSTSLAAQTAKDIE